MNNDLISRSALLELAHSHVGGTVDCNDIARFPSVDAEPVRHGYWINHFDDLHPEESFQECSECHAETNGYLIEDDFCPNCGAKMEGDKHEPT